MKHAHPFNWQPLSQEQKNQLEIWQMSPNPADRLNTGYYTMQRHLALQDYFKMVKDAQDADDFELMEEARDAFFGSLEVFRRDYQQDLQLLIEMQLTVASVFNPFDWWPMGKAIID